MNPINNMAPGAMAPGAAQQALQQGQQAFQQGQMRACQPEMVHRITTQPIQNNYDGQNPGNMYGNNPNMQLQMQLGPLIQMLQHFLQNIIGQMGGGMMVNYQQPNGQGMMGGQPQNAFAQQPQSMLGPQQGAVTSAADAAAQLDNSAMLTNFLGNIVNNPTQNAGGAAFNNNVADASDPGRGYGGGVGPSVYPPMPNPPATGGGGGGGGGGAYG